MNHRMFSCCSLLGSFLLAPSFLCGQTSEHHAVEHLTASELGPFDPVATPDLTEVATMIVKQTNQFRQAEKRKPVKVNSILRTTATDFAQYMAKTDQYGHRADGRGPSARVTAQGYHFCIVEENIAYDFKTTGFTTQKLANAFMEGWKKSPPHRRNMLEPNVTEIGVAVAQSQTTGVFYAVQDFGRPKADKIEFRVVNHTETPFDYQIAGRSYELPRAIPESTPCVSRPN